MDMGLSGVVVLVTGGASGIGLACGAAFAAEGATVTLLDLDRANTEAAAEKLLVPTGRVRAVPADVRDERAVADAIEQVVVAHGRLDVVVGCDGVSGPVGRSVTEVTAEEWDVVQAVNVRGQFFLA